MKKVCKNCKKDFDGSKNQIYCSSGCKQESYRIRNGLEKPQFLKDYTYRKPTSKMVITQNQLKSITDYQLKIIGYEKEFSSLSEKITSEKLKLENLKKQRLLIIKNPLEIPIGEIENGFWKFSAEIFNSFTEQQRKKEIKGKIEKIDIQIKEKINLINTLLSSKNKLNDKIRIAKDTVNSIKKDVENRQAALNQYLENTSNKVVSKKIEVVDINDISNLTFETFDLSDSKFSKVGNPAKNFKMFLWGLSGSGKSTYSIELLSYLSKHEKTIFLTNEEELGESFKLRIQKIIENNSSIKLSNIKKVSFSRLYDFVKTSEYKVIVIDSITNLNLSSEEFKKLMKIDKAIIYIAQSTKGNTYRGDSILAHDSDIIIRMENYTPIVEKTRFK